MNLHRHSELEATDRLAAEKCVAVVTYNLKDTDGQRICFQVAEYVREVI